MREYFYPIDEHLQHGLAPRQNFPSNAKFLAYAKNAVPESFGVRFPTILVNPFDEEFEDPWPFPQLFQGDEFRLLCGEDWIAYVEDDWSLTKLDVEIVPGGPWHFASFGPSFFLTNGVTFVWKIAANPNGEVMSTTDLRVATLTKINNRLVLGGVRSIDDGYGASLFDSAEWHDLYLKWRQTSPPETFVSQDMQFGPHYVLWSEQGGGADDKPFAIFLSMLGLFEEHYNDIKPLLDTYIEAGEIGMRPVMGTGSLLHLRPLGRFLAAYGERGMARLDPQENRYLAVSVGRSALVGRSAVTGDASEHCGICDRGLFRWPYDGQPIMEEYNYYVGVLNGNLTIAALDEHDRVYSFADGELAYQRSLQGLGGPMSLMPTSDVLPDRVAIFKDTGDREMRIRTWHFDTRERGTKHVACVQVRTENLTNKALRVHWRTNGGAFRQMPPCPVSPDGVSYPGVSFVDAMIDISGVSENGDGSINGIEIRYNAEDRTHRRGISAENTAED